MARDLTHHCTECGVESRQWHGHCRGCEAWNTLVEERARAQAARLLGR